MSDLRIAQYFRLTTPSWVDGLSQQRPAQLYLFQNYFVAANSTYLSESYAFAPFRAEGSMAALNGDNNQLTVLFPHEEYGLRLVEAGNGNRLSELRLTTAWLTEGGQITNAVNDYFIGVGASFSDTTIELRYRSAIDSVGSAFPARSLTRDLVGPLPLNSELYLR